MIQLHNLSFTYKDTHKPALKNINLDICKGDFVGIIGESGAGKSTLAYTINGVIPHFYKGEFFGSAFVNGLDTFEVGLDELSQFVGSIFQDIDGQMVTSVVEDEILFGLENFGVPKVDMEERISQSLENVGISHLRHRSLHSLSGGQKQKVALSAILALRPDILVLDEPTGELDPQSTLQIFMLLQKLNSVYGITIVVIEQKIMMLCEFARTMVVMSNGTIAYQGPVRTVLQNSHELENIGVNCPRVVTLANRLDEMGISFHDIWLSSQEAAQALTDRSVTFKAEPYSSVESLSENEKSDYIRFNHVSFGYKKNDSIIRDISFGIKKGDFVAFIGSNGAGKSTISKMMNGLVVPTSGDVFIDGLNTRYVRTSELAKKIGFLFQNPDIQICQTTVKEELLFGLRNIFKDEDFISSRYSEIQTEFAFDENADPFQLSRGERQLLALASVFAIQPDVLILDEPTTGLDYKECMHIMDYITKLNKLGTTIIMVCHDMELVLDFARTTMIVHDGRLLAYNKTRTIFSDTDLLEKASLVAPQILQLSKQLDVINPMFFTIEEVLERINIL